MRTQLLKRPVDHRHADELAAALALPEYLDRDRLGVGTLSVRGDWAPPGDQIEDAECVWTSALCFHCAATYLVYFPSTLGIYPLVAPNIGRCMYGNGRLGRSSYVLTLTTYADYIPEQETENPLPEPVAPASVDTGNVVTLHRSTAG
jgi:hypothetical protein